VPSFVGNFKKKGGVFMATRNKPKLTTKQKYSFIGLIICVLCMGVLTEEQQKVESNKHFLASE
jgi:hypothetical protein